MADGVKLMKDALPGLIEYLPMTLYFLIVPSIISLILGSMICAVRVGRKNVLYRIATVFVSFFRGTPSLVQLYLVLYGLPKLFEIFGVNINRWSAATFFVIASILNFSSFVSEALRGAYLAMKCMAEQIAVAFGATAKFLWFSGPSATNNRREWVEFSNEVAKKSDLKVVPYPSTLIGEDFAYYQEKIEGAFIWVGVDSLFPLHNPKFIVNTDAIESSSKYFANLAENALLKLK